MFFLFKFTSVLLSSNRLIYTHFDTRSFRVSLCLTHRFFSRNTFNCITSQFQNKVHCPLPGNHTLAKCTVRTKVLNERDFYPRCELPFSWQLEQGDTDEALYVNTKKQTK